MINGVFCLSSQPRLGACIYGGKGAGGRDERKIGTQKTILLALEGTADYCLPVHYPVAARA